MLPKKSLIGKLEPVEKIEEISAKKNKLKLGITEDKIVPDHLKCLIEEVSK